LSFGIASVAAITVICYLVGLLAKTAPGTPDNIIPAVCGLAGAALGIVGLYLGLPDFPAGDPLTAAAVGIVSGLAATGVDQIGKQFGKDQ